MAEKRGYEDFRHRQFAQPHPALACKPRAEHGGASDLLDVVPDYGRVIIHFDVDCFYAQVEEVRNPELKGKPLGVTQKYLVVTSNYEARRCGVTKLMGIQDALAKCPELNLVAGEDLTPYRRASKAVWALLKRYGTVQRGGLDEAFLDATAEVHSRLRRQRAGHSDSSGPGDASVPKGASSHTDDVRWEGHLWTNCEKIVQDSRHRPQDLRVMRGGAGPTVPTRAPRDVSQDDNSAAAAAATTAAVRGTMDEQEASGVAMASGAGHTASSGKKNGTESFSWQQLLMVGSQVAQEARSRIKAEAGIRTSAGVAGNKLLAKLASGLHKPDDQTIMPPDAAAAFLTPLPVRSLPGVGYKTAGILAQLDVATVRELRQMPMKTLVDKLGSVAATAIAGMAWGKDPSEVTESGPPKSITCEDSFKSASSFDALRTVVHVIVPDLVARIVEEHEETGRWPRTLVVKWRHRGTGFHRTAASAPLIGEFRIGADRGALGCAAADLTMSLLRKHLAAPFTLTLLNIGVTSFSDNSTPSGVPKLQQFFSAPKAPEPRSATGPTENASALSILDKRPRSDEALPGPRSVSAGQARVASDGKRLCVARRDYGAAGVAGAVSKRMERALMDAAIGISPDIPLAARASPNSASHAVSSTPPAALVRPPAHTLAAALQDADAPASPLPCQRAPTPGFSGPTARSSRTLAGDMASVPDLPSGLIGVLSRDTACQICTQSLRGRSGDTSFPSHSNGVPPETPVDAPSALPLVQNDASMGWPPPQQAPPSSKTRPADLDMPAGAPASAELQDIATPALLFERSANCEAVGHRSGQNTSGLPGFGRWAPPSGALALPGVLQYEAVDAAFGDEPHSSQYFTQSRAADDEPRSPHSQTAGAQVTELAGAALGAADLESGNADIAEGTAQDRSIDDAADAVHVPAVAHGRGSGAITPTLRRRVDDASHEAPAVVRSGRTGGEDEASVDASKLYDGLTPPTEPASLGAPWSQSESMDDSFFTCGSQPNGQSSQEGPPAAVGSRVVLHVDVDCFYCSVEAIDNPAIRGKPVAVQQFNSGGFVAVNYEARAAGVKCGDGVGAGGRANIAHLQRIGAVSLQAARAKCPGLIVLPMRTDRYREVAASVHSALRPFACNGVVDKTSYDDFYLDVTPTPAALSEAASDASQGMSGLNIIDLAPGRPDLDNSVPPQLGSRVSNSATAADSDNKSADLLTPDLRHGAAVALRIQASLQQQIGLTVSIGVARTRLLSRLVSPLHKPSAVTVLPDTAALPFLHAQPIRSVPTLRGKWGSEVCEAFGISAVGDLVKLERSALEARFGPKRAEFLAQLPSGGDGGAVAERGPPKSILEERSYPSLGSLREITNAIRPLAERLWRRLLDDARATGRRPSKLVALWRHGHETSRSKSQAVPTNLAAALQRALRGPSEALDAGKATGNDGDASCSRGAAQHATAGDETAGTGRSCSAVDAHASACAELAVEAIVTEALTQINAYAQHPLQVTRVAVSVTFDDVNSPAAGQRSLFGFLRKAGAPASSRSSSQQEPPQSPRVPGAAPPGARRTPHVRLSPICSRQAIQVVPMAESDAVVSEQAGDIAPAQLRDAVDASQRVPCSAQLAGLTPTTRDSLSVAAPSSGRSEADAALDAPASPGLRSLRSRQHGASEDSQCAVDIEPQLVSAAQPVDVAARDDAPTHCVADINRQGSGLRSVSPCDAPSSSAPAKLPGGTAGHSAISLSSADAVAGASVSDPGMGAPFGDCDAEDVARGHPEADGHEQHAAAVPSVSTERRVACSDSNAQPLDGTQSRALDPKEAMQQGLVREAKAEVKDEASVAQRAMGQDTQAALQAGVAALESRLRQGGCEVDTDLVLAMRLQQYELRGAGAGAGRASSAARRGVTARGGGVRGCGGRGQRGRGGRKNGRGSGAPAAAGRGALDKFLKVVRK